MWLVHSEHWRVPRYKRVWTLPGRRTFSLLSCNFKMKLEKLLTRFISSFFYITKTGLRPPSTVCARWILIGLNRRHLWYLVSCYSSQLQYASESFWRCAPPSSFSWLCVATALLILQKWAVHVSGPPARRSPVTPLSSEHDITPNDACW